jgi:hypothetical protein
MGSGFVLTQWKCTSDAEVELNRHTFTQTITKKTLTAHTPFHRWLCQCCFSASKRDTFVKKTHHESSCRLFLLTKHPAFPRAGQGC